MIRKSSYHVSRMAIPVIALFVILTMTVGIFMSKALEQENLRRIGRGFYSGDAVFFEPSGPASAFTRQFPELIDLSDTTDYLVVSYAQDTRGVFYRGSPALPPMLEGRFLTEEETRSDTLLAVVGDARWDEVTEENGQTTTEQLGRTYQVIGRMGTDYDSAINRLVMVSIASMPEESRTSGILYVDGKNPDAVFAAIQEHAAGMGVSAPRQTDKPLEPIEAFYRQNTWSYTYLILIIAVMVSSSAILLMEWMRSQIHRIAVYRLVGYDGTRICTTLLRRFLTLALIGIGIGLLAMGVLSAIDLFQLHSTFVKQAVYVAAASLGVGLVIQVPALLRAVRVDVIRILR